jgi:hypothetical protein
VLENKKYMTVKRYYGLTAKLLAEGAESAKKARGKEMELPSHGLRPPGEKQSPQEDG